MSPEGTGDDRSLTDEDLAAIRAMLVDAFAEVLRDMEARWEVGRRLRCAREHARLSQETLGERLGVGPETISECEWVPGKVPAGYAERLLAACDLPSDWAPPPLSPAPTPTLT